MLIVAAGLAASMPVFGQVKYFTKQGNISFDASAGSEKVQAINDNGICILDQATGVIQLAVLMKGFEFEKALMQEHFNENYAESDKYPKCEFRGQIVNNGDVLYSKDGTYAVHIRGQLALHGTKKDVMAEGSLMIREGKIEATAEFRILLADYGIAIPGLVKDKVSDQPMIRVNCILQPVKN